MLPKKARLTSPEVEEVLKRGVSVSITPKNGGKSLISLKFLAQLGGFKVSVVAPKSVAKSAVARNRLRRAVYRAISALPLPKKHGIAVFFVRSIPKAPLTPAYQEEVSLFFQKISAN
jgi:ribonuclease P protein component